MSSRTQHLHATVVLALLALFATGCDHCRAGRYSVAVVPTLEVFSASIPAEARVRVLTPDVFVASCLATTLQAHGFAELRPGYWTRRGADVQWQVSRPGEVTLCISAFGSKREVRESERAELELVRALLLQTDIAVRPVEPARETVQR